MKKLWLQSCVLALSLGAPTVQASAEIRIYDVRPGVVEPGDTIHVLGSNFGSRHGKRLVVYRVEDGRVYEPPVAIHSWVDHQIVAELPRGLPADRYGVLIRVIGREFLSSNQVLLVVQPPAPRAVAAGRGQVFDNDCRELTNSSDNRYERSVVAECPRPLRDIWISDARLAHPRGQVIIGGAGPNRDDVVIALVGVDVVRTGRATDQRLYVHRILENFGGRNGYLGAGLPEDLEPGRYAVAILYRAHRGPYTGYVKGSNAVWFDVRDAR
jgi:hypothetical protein